MQRLTYEISSTTTGEDWEQVIRATDLFSREPNDVARGLLESWIIDHPHEVAGGARIVVPTESDPEAPETIEATVRVFVYAAEARDAAEPGEDGEDGRNETEDEPVAVGYLGYDKRDFTGDIPRV